MTYLQALDLFEKNGWQFEKNEDGYTYVLSGDTVLGCGHTPHQAVFDALKQQGVI